MSKASFEDPRVQALLAERAVAVLATVSPDGAPLAMAMWFAPDATGIVMVSADGLAKVRNMRRDPRVCVTVESEAGGALRCAVVRGRARFVDAGERRRVLVARMHARYPELEARWGGRDLPADRVLFEIVPEWVSYYG